MNTKLFVFILVNKNLYMFDNYNNEISCVVNSYSHMDKLLTYSSGVEPSKNSFSNFKIGELLGKGKFSNVYKCKRKNNTNDNEVYAIKIIDSRELSQKTYSSIVGTEIKILHICDHPNIIKMYEWFHNVNTNSTYILLEYTPYVDLYTYTHNMKDHMHPRTCISYMKQLWGCLIFLRDNNIIHRDIKPENMLVFDKGDTIKLTDFGWGYIIDKSNNYTKPYGEIAGTTDYVAPEVMLELEHD